MSGITPRKPGNSGSRIIHPEPAEGTGQAFDATVQTINAHGIPGADRVGDATVVRGPRHVTDQLVVMARLLVWTPLTGHLPEMSLTLWRTQLSEQPTWMVEVAEEVRGLIDSGIELENDQIGAFLGVAESLLPSGVGPWRLTIKDLAGEEIDGGLGYDSIEGLATLAESLLPRHPG